MRRYTITKLSKKLCYFSTVGWEHLYFFGKCADVITLLPPHLDGLYEGPRRRKSWHQTSWFGSGRWSSPGCPQGQSFSCYPEGWDIYPGEEENCQQLCTPASQVATVTDSTLPVVEKRPHRVSRCWVGKAVSYPQGKCRVWGRLSDGDFHICCFTQGQSHRKLVLRKEGGERSI